DDVCDAFVRAIASKRPRTREIYNVGSGTQTSLRELVELARRALGVSASPRWGSHPAHPWDATVWVADASKIKRELGWEPRHDVERGLRELAEWLSDSAALHQRYGVVA